MKDLMKVISETHIVRTTLDMYFFTNYTKHPVKCIDRSIDWLIDSLTLSQQYFSYMNDENNVTSNK
jgi:hypothetical protein